MKIEYVPIDKLIPYARNPRKIPQSAIDKVASSIHEFGWRQPIVTDGDFVIIVGHVRYQAAQKLGLETVPVHVADLTPTQAKAYRLADNRSHEDATWDEELLVLEIRDLQEANMDIGLTGFEMEDLRNMPRWQAELEGELGGDERPPSDGSLLDLVNVVIKEPEHRVEPGDVWELGEHLLICEEVVTGWPAWKEHLREGVYFAPYPGPFVPLSLRAEEQPMVMVQPDPYIAGHVLDQYVRVKGKVRKR